MPKTSSKSRARSRTRAKRKQIEKQVEVIIEDEAPTLLEQVRALDTKTSKLIKKIDYIPGKSNDTVGEALSLACECFHVALTRLKKNEQAAQEQAPQQQAHDAQPAAQS